MSSIDECVAYFRNTEGFTRLMNGLFDMYVRYERCFGAVRLVKPSAEEEKAISDFFKRDYYDQALIRISLADFERQLQKNFSSAIQLEALLETYNRRAIVRRGGPRVTVNAFSTFVENELIPKYIETEAELWLREVVAHTKRTYRRWAEAFTREPKKIVEMLETVCGALNDLPCLRCETESLIDFTKRHHENPHAFSINSAFGPLIFRALVRRFDMPLPATAEEGSALYFKAGLLTEGVLNRVVVRNMMAWRGDEPDEVCAWYQKRNEAFVLTLEQLSAFTRAEAHRGIVYVLENMDVFSAVNEQIRGQNCSVICIEGGVNAAAACLLDLLNASGTRIYYSGDMDYTGLALADRMYLSYPKNFVPWRYGKEDYEKILSESEIYLPDHKKDQGLHNEYLASLLSLMRKKGKTVPQMALMGELVKDLTEEPADD
jgi:uncharacterized protein (TIGR02679 family)